jgi:hypothetical protein
MDFLEKVDDKKADDKQKSLPTPTQKILVGAIIALAVYGLLKATKMIK